MTANHITYKVGIPEKYRDTVVSLFDLAFGKKISVAIPEYEKRMQLLRNCMNLDYAIGAFLDDELLGIAGFYAKKGSLTRGKYGYFNLISLLGFIKGTRAACILVLYARKPKPKQLVMDGISVHSDARGKGIGSGLLDEIKKYAAEHGCTSVRLDVIDTNPRAKKLYEREGFKLVKNKSFPFLQKVLGFGGVSTMGYKIEKNA